MSNKITTDLIRNLIRQSQSNIPKFWQKLNEAEDRTVVSHLNGAFVWSSVGAVVTQIAPNNLKITTPSTAASYASIITATRDFGLISKKYIELKIKCDDWSKLSSITLDIVPVSAVSANYYRKIFNVSELSNLVNGTEKVFKCHVDELSIAGTPPPLQLSTTGRISISVTNSGVVNVNVLDGLVFTSSPNYHMIQFDDGLSGVYDYAYPIMKRLGIVGTAFISTSQIGDAGHMTIDQMRELQDNGWTIANHGHTHIDLISSPKELAITSVELGAKILSQYGFSGARFLAAPFNSFDSTIAPYMSHVVSGVRIGMGSGLGAFGSIYKRKQYPASTYGNSVLNTDSVQEMYDKYILARDKNVLYSFLFHNLDLVDDTTYKWTPSKFEELLLKLKNDGVMFINFEEYMHAYLDTNEVR